jgi:hypothetical protein
MAQVYNDLKVGDTVRRTAWVPTRLQTDYPIMQVGAEFVVDDICCRPKVYFKATGCIGWSLNGFEKVTKDAQEPLTANAAAELLIEGTEQLQYHVQDTWYDVRHPNLWTVADLREITFRVKPVPKTIKINGVTVLAPVKLKRGTPVYYPCICRSNVQRDFVGDSITTYWATREGAQAALDAMLLPLKEL